MERKPLNCNYIEIVIVTIQSHRQLKSDRDHCNLTMQPLDRVATIVLIYHIYLVVKSPLEDLGGLQSHLLKK